VIRQDRKPRNSFSLLPLFPVPILNKPHRLLALYLLFCLSGSGGVADRKYCSDISSDLRDRPPASCYTRPAIMDASAAVVTRAN
jgi:hypothetical protein